MALMVIAAQSLGMGLDAPRGRVIAIAYNAKTKGLQNVKKKYMWMQSTRRKHV